VLAWTAREIGAGASLAGYGDGDARWEHQAEIRRAYGYTPFGDSRVEDELSLWLRASVDEPRATKAPDNRHPATPHRLLPRRATDRELNTTPALAA